MDTSFQRLDSKAENLIEKCDEKFKKTEENEQNQINSLDSAKTE